LLLELVHELAACGSTWWNIVIVQLMEGFSTGLGLRGHPGPSGWYHLAGTGHAGGGLSGVMMAYGAGAA
jgi:hypothetical protein